MVDKQVQYDTKLYIIDIDTNKFIGEKHILTLKLADSNGNGIAGQIINIGDLGIVITGVDGQAVFSWPSNSVGETEFTIKYIGKSDNKNKIKYNAADSMVRKFITIDSQPIEEVNKDQSGLNVGKQSIKKDNEKNSIKNTGTIDYGIDLGTTTSSVAKIDGNSTMVIPNAIDNKNFIASAVYINKNGRQFIGERAKNKIAIDPDNGFSEFKLRMGSDDVYEFKATGQKTTPVELSAEILKNLKQSVYEKNQKDLKAAVITVPADFNALQTKATRDAAELAGFEEVILLQEPTAAAMAYGMGSSKENEIWLIYDFGGGTFDLSIMKKDQEGIQNINNDGDAYLGGKLIDFDIVDKVFVPAILEEIDLENFNRNNKKYFKQFAKLKKAAEIAKTELSNDDTAEVFIENFVLGDDGGMYDFEYEMTRSQLDEVMKPYVDRTINHCHRALEDVNLSISDVTKIILVGGSTLSPYIHERLKDEFGIPLEYSIDPTTVVARGAAVFAGTKQYVERKGTTDQVSIELKYKTIGDDIEFNVQGVLNVPGGSPEDYSVEFINNKTKYASGKITVDNGGFFMTSLLAESEDEENTYQIKVYDKMGNVAILSPNSHNTVKYRCGFPLACNVGFPHTIGVKLYGNELDFLINKNTPLPTSASEIYKIPETVHSGNPKDKIFFPIYQENKCIGCLEISGEDVDRTLPEGHEIEFTIFIDESMNIEVNAYIPFLDKDFEVIIDSNSEKLKYQLEEFEQQQRKRYNQFFDEIELEFNNPAERLIKSVEETSSAVKFNHYELYDNFLSDETSTQINSCKESKGFPDEKLAEDNEVYSDGQSMNLKESCSLPNVSEEDSSSDIHIHAYNGVDDYVFISYAHSDAEFVLSELEHFNNYGINIWYDEGITPSTQWPEVIQEKLENSSLFVVFITPNSVESQNVRNEINFALSIKLPFVAIHLKNTELKYGMLLQMSSIQAILKYELDDDVYIDKCLNAFEHNGFTIDVDYVSSSQQNPISAPSDENVLKEVNIDLLNDVEDHCLIVKANLIKNKQRLLDFVERHSNNVNFQDMLKYKSIINFILIPLESDIKILDLDFKKVSISLKNSEYISKDEENQIILNKLDIAKQIEFLKFERNKLRILVEYIDYSLQYALKIVSSDEKIFKLPDIDEFECSLVSEFEK